MHVFRPVRVWVVARTLRLHCSSGPDCCCSQVLLVSAQQALLSRLVLQGKADKDISSRFGRLAFGSRAKNFSQQEHQSAAEDMLSDSGLAELEETVLAFLYNHSGSLKLLALLDDIVRMLQQACPVPLLETGLYHRGHPLHAWSFVRPRLQFYRTRSDCTLPLAGLNGESLRAGVCSCKFHAHIMSACLLLCHH